MPVRSSTIHHLKNSVGVVIPVRSFEKAAAAAFAAVLGASGAKRGPPFDERFRVAPDFHKIAAIRDLAALRSERFHQGMESVVDSVVDLKGTQS